MYENLHFIVFQKLNLFVRTSFVCKFCNGTQRKCRLSVSPVTLFRHFIFSCLYLKSHIYIYTSKYKSLIKISHSVCIKIKCRQSQDHHCSQSVDTNLLLMHVHAAMGPTPTICLSQLDVPLHFSELIRLGAHSNTHVYHNTSAFALFYICNK